MVLYIKSKEQNHTLEGITNDLLKEVEWEEPIQNFMDSNNENLAYFESIIFDEDLFEESNVLDQMEFFSKIFNGKIILFSNKDSKIKEILGNKKKIFFLDRQEIPSLKTQYSHIMNNRPFMEKEEEIRKPEKEVSKKERFMKAKQEVLFKEKSEESEEAKTNEKVKKEIETKTKEQEDLFHTEAIRMQEQQEEEKISEAEKFRQEIAESLFSKPEEIKKPVKEKEKKNENDLKKMSRAERIAHIRQANLQANLQNPSSEADVQKDIDIQEDPSYREEIRMQEQKEEERTDETEKLQQEIEESLFTSSEEIKERTKKVQEKMKEYEDHAVYQKKDLLKFMRKNYDQEEEWIVHNKSETSEEEEIEFKLDLPDEEILEKKNTKKNKKIALPRINIKKTAKNQKKSEEEKEQREGTFTLSSSGRTEIGMIGTDRGVGTTFAGFYIAQKYSFKKSIAYVIKDSKEVLLLQKAKEEGFIGKNISIYEEKDILSAYKECEVVIIDFGVMDRSNKNLMIDFERCQEKFVVTNFSFNKRFSFNNLLQYHNEGSKFTAVLNFMNVSECETVQRMFKDISMINIPFMAS